MRREDRRGISFPFVLLASVAVAGSLSWLHLLPCRLCSLGPDPTVVAAPTRQPTFPGFVKPLFFPPPSSLGPERGGGLGVAF